MADGLSPRGRGNLRRPRACPSPSGSIPAWAGEPPLNTIPIVPESVYPRVGGGTFHRRKLVPASAGLSPRGRGNHVVAQDSAVDRGSIPAWAGEPVRSIARSYASSVYPRVGGGTHQFVNRTFDGVGLSPRGRGNLALTANPIGIIVLRVYPRVGGGTFKAGWDKAVGIGLSPRGRGNHRWRCPQLLRERSIPAWAGEPPPGAYLPSSITVYPRVGGGTKAIRTRDAGLTGLSPRGRGNPSAPTSLKYRRRSIPAWAGEPRYRGLYGHSRGVYPRVGGGTPHVPCVNSPAQGLSPRGRGNHSGSRRGDALFRSIPAWAGEPPSWPPPPPTSAVYPRVGGGTFPLSGLDIWALGLSPRGRGNRITRSWRPPCLRSIPAWAGEPVTSWVSPPSVSVYPRVGGGTNALVSMGHCLTALSPRGRGNPVSSICRMASRRSIPAWAGEPPHWDRILAGPRVYPRVGGGTERAEGNLLLGIGLSPRGRGNRPNNPFQGGSRRSIPAWAGEPLPSRT